MADLVKPTNSAIMIGKYVMNINNLLIIILHSN